MSNGVLHQVIRIHLDCADDSGETTQRWIELTEDLLIRYSSISRRLHRRHRNWSGHRFLHTHQDTTRPQFATRFGEKSGSTTTRFPPAHEATGQLDRAC